MIVRRHAGSPALRSLLLFALALPVAAVASVSSPEARLQVELARVLRQVGNAPAAETALARALEIDPSCATAWLERGFLAEDSGSFSRARRAFTRAFELAPALGDPSRNPELVASRAALAAQLELWRRAASAPLDEPTAGMAFELVAPPATTPPAAPTPRVAKPPLARTARVLGANDLVSSGPVNQVLAPGSAPSRAAPNRRLSRVQRFRPPPQAEEPVIENEEAPPEQAGEEVAPAEEATDESGEATGDPSDDEPPPPPF